MATETKVPAAAAEDETKVLLPGVEVYVMEKEEGEFEPDASKAERYRGRVTVYPIGLRHMKLFSRGIAGLLAAVGDVRVPVGGSKDDVMKSLGTQAMLSALPYILENLMELVDACCEAHVDGHTVAVSSLPHWDVPPVIEAWLVESFGSEKKWKPWVATIESLAQRVTGKSLGLLEAISGLGESSTSETVSSS